MNRELFTKQLGYDLGVGILTGLGAAILTSVLANEGFGFAFRLGLIVVAVHAVSSAFIGYFYRTPLPTSTGRRG